MVWMIVEIIDHCVSTVIFTVICCNMSKNKWFKSTFILSIYYKWKVKFVIFHINAKTICPTWCDKIITSYCSDFYWYNLLFNGIISFIYCGHKTKKEYKLKEINISYYSYCHVLLCFVSQWNMAWFELFIEIF